MKTYWGLPLVLMLPAAMALGATGAKRVVDPDKLPKISCDEFRFSDAFLQKYPKAPAACVEGRVKDGVRYAKFQTKVYISSPEFMTVQLLDPSGNMLSTFSFKAPPDARVMVEGKRVKFSDMPRGSTLTVWVPEGRMEVQALPAPTADHWVVLPPQPAQ